jgi:DNA-binding GntR family transcriptional regulator
MAQKSQSTSAALADRIRHDIAEGDLLAGQPMPQEELSARLGVSRSPLREALRQLESEGWVIYHPNRGAFVAAMSARDVRDFYQVRRVLEAGALRLAFPHIDSHIIARARAMHAAMLKETALRKFVARHFEFHRGLYEAAGNPRLLETIERNHIRIDLLPDWKRQVAAVRRCARTDHRALLSALERRDAAAALRVTLSHLDHMKEIALGSIAR